MHDNAFPPIAIGGLGGSGTRVFAELLSHAGVDIGPQTNGALDNLWFTLLFKRSAWAGRGQLPEGDIAKAVSLFVRGNTDGLAGNTTAQEAALLEGLLSELPPTGTWRSGASQESAQALIHSHPRTPRRWGWKEPNTHIFLRHLDQHITGLRYIHILRSGIDMAFSQNVQQLGLWASCFGVSTAPGQTQSQRQLQYWIAANREALSYGMTHMKGRFMAIRYEAFCEDPFGHWEQMAPFIQANADLSLPEELVRPTTIGRAESRDLSEFASEDMQAALAVESELEKSPVLA